VDEESLALLVPRHLVDEVADLCWLLAGVVSLARKEHTTRKVEEAKGHLVHLSADLGRPSNGVDHLLGDEVGLGRRLLDTSAGAVGTVGHRTGGSGNPAASRDVVEKSLRR